jgi:dCTP diphosphatase
MTRRTRASSPRTGGDTLAQLRDDLRKFAAQRDWEQFHTPKNLAMALAIEAAEVMEHFQWLTPEQSAALPAPERKALGHEIADVLLYLTRLADVTGIDPIAAARSKLAINARRYPVRAARGNALKYDRLASAGAKAGSGKARKAPRPRTSR